MGWKSFVGGAAFGVFVGVAALFAWTAYSPLNPKVPADETIAFTNKNFYDSSKTGGGGYINLSGTITGDGVGSRNNTVTFRCNEDQKKCVAGSVAQIGGNQVNEVTVEDWEITEWSPQMIVAVNEGMCARSTLNIMRQSEHVGYVQEPINQSLAYCDKSDSHVYKWTVEPSLWWQRMNKPRT